MKQEENEIDEDTEDVFNDFLHKTFILIDDFV